MRGNKYESDLHDIDVCLHSRTEKAVYVSLDGDSAKAVWVPLSQIEFVPTNSKRREYLLTGPQWLLHEKGLV